MYGVKLVGLGNIFRSCPIRLKRVLCILSHSSERDDNTGEYTGLK